MRKLHLLPLCAVFGLVANVAAASQAKDVRMLAQTKITLQQAIDAAQRHQGGQALGASLDDDRPKPVYEISIVKDNRVYDVWVDGVNGKVLEAREDVQD